MKTSGNGSRYGFTLIELLVVIAIIAVFMATLLPAVQAAREAGRRATCQSRAQQLIIGLAHYHSAQESLPAGTVNAAGPIRNEPIGYHHNWIGAILPYLDEATVQSHIDFSAGVYEEANSQVRGLQLAALVCPSHHDTTTATSHYAGCHHDLEAPIDADNHGVLILNRRISERDITDGLAHTIFLGEKICDPDDLGWMSGTRATLRNTGLAIANPRTLPPPATAPGDPAELLQRVGGFGSYHPGAAIFAFGDGSVLVVADTIDMQLYRQLADRADGQLTDDASLH